MSDDTAVTFKTTQNDKDALNMMGAISAAKAAVEAMTGQQTDSIVTCARATEGNWTVSVDVIESFARMGDNDLLATYQVELDAQAELINFNRLRRYHREDQES